MCGICGVFHPDRERPVDAVALRRMAASIRHRGPDGEGFFAGPGVGLGFRRLAIVDLDHGDQPLENETGEVRVVCNGEVYNAPELRDRLRERGHVFRSMCDVEVIVHLYEEMGLDFVAELRGMFALALWDGAADTLVLARDRFGIKPLCYAEAPGGSVVFGSEAKAVLASGMVEPALDPRGLADVIGFGGTVLGRTMFRGIRELGPGELMVCRRSTVDVRRYWDLDLGRVDGGRSEQDWADELRAKLDESVGIHLRADVPIGSWLSPGIDSSAVTALARDRVAGPLATFSLGFDDPHADELRSSPTLDKYEPDGLDPTEVRYPEDAPAMVPDAIWALEKPSRLTLGTWTLSRAASERFKVVVTGQGSDEMLAGYPWHWIDRWLRCGTAPFWRSMRRATFPAAIWQRVAPNFHALATAPDRMDPTRFGAILSVAHSRTGLNVLAPELRREVADHLAGDHELRTPDGYDRWCRQRRFTYIESRTRLVGFINHAMDRCSMAHSLEARVPFLDHELAELIAAMPARVKRHRGREKHILREAMRPVLPVELVERRKRGLFTPIPDVRRPSVADLRDDLLSDRRMRESGYLDARSVRRMVDGPPRDSWGHRSALLLAFGLQVWDERFVRAGGSAAERAEPAAAAAAG